MASFLTNDRIIRISKCNKCVRLLDPGEGTGTRLDYLANRAGKQIEGPLGKTIAQKSRNSHIVSGGGVGAEGMVTKGANWRSPGTKYKRSKIAFAIISIALTLEPRVTKLFSFPCSL